MYTVGIDKLPDQECAVEAASLMQETFAWAEKMPHAGGVNFYGTVYEDSTEQKRFKVMCYVGRVTGIISEPPAFTILVEEAALQTANCNCPGFNPDDIFENFEQVLQDAELSRELDEFAGVETRDPHYEDLPVLAGTEATLRFDRLGAYLVSGIIPGIIG